MKTPLQLVLASTSPYRRQLLERLTMDFLCDPSQADESAPPYEQADIRAQRLACAKACAVAARHPHSLVIGCDQLAAIDNTVLGKPGSHVQAVVQLNNFSGRTVYFHTAVCVVNTENRQRYEHMDTTRVHFRKLDTEEIERYLQAEQPYDCAGSFRSEGLGISLFDAIETEDPTALIGLPLIALCRLLRICGVQLP